jgi:hypothetical protein
LQRENPKALVIFQQSFVIWFPGVYKLVVYKGQAVNLPFKVGIADKESFLLPRMGD